MNRENLTKLADYLAALPADYDHFDMFDYYRNIRIFGYILPIESALPDKCGAVACAVGHGPAAGIPPVAGEDWTTYGHRVFDMGGEEWYWCFSDKWTGIDNTPHGAAKRIRHLLEHGLPEDATDQQYGFAPYLFAKQAV